MTDSTSKPGELRSVPAHRVQHPHGPPLPLRDRFWRFVIAVSAALQRYAWARLRVHVWRTFDGRVIPVRSMSDTHLRNAIRLLERGDEPQPIYEVLLMEQFRRAARDPEMRS